MIAVGSGTSTAAENVRGKVVNLLAVLVTYDGATCRSGVCSQYHTVLKALLFFWLIDKNNRSKLKQSLFYNFLPHR